MTHLFQFPGAKKKKQANKTVLQPFATSQPAFLWVLFFQARRELPSVCRQIWSSLLPPAGSLQLRLVPSSLQQLWSFLQPAGARSSAFLRSCLPAFPPVVIPFPAAFHGLHLKKKNPKHFPKYLATTVSECFCSPQHAIFSSMPSKAYLGQPKSSTCVDLRFLPPARSGALLTRPRMVFVTSVDISMWKRDSDVLLEDQEQF